jgi:hypothetical protein
MEVLDSVDTEQHMSAETRARIFEPFYTPKQTPECSHVISKIIFSRAQRNRALRQCDQSTSAKCNSCRLQESAPCDFLGSHRPSMPLPMPHHKSRPHLGWGFYFDQLSDDLLLRKGKPLRKKHHHAQSNIA